MTTELKQIADALTKAVSETEANEAAEIDSILKSLNDNWQIYSAKTHELSKGRDELIKQLDALEDVEAAASQIYMKNLQELTARLDMFRKVKLGGTTTYKVGTE